MGFEKIWELLAPAAVKLNSIQSLSNKRIAIDGSSWLSSIKKRYVHTDYSQLFILLCQWISMGIKPIFIFPTSNLSPPTPPSKESELNGNSIKKHGRQKSVDVFDSVKIAKQKSKPLPSLPIISKSRSNLGEEFQIIQELISVFEFPYVITSHEPSAYCSILKTLNYIDAIVSDNSDVFLFGGDSVFKNVFDDKDKLESYEMKDILEKLGLYREKLIELALLFGCVENIGLRSSLEIINTFPGDNGLKQFHDWIQSEETSKEMDETDRTLLKQLKTKLKIQFDYPYERVRQNYLYPTSVGKLDDTFEWKKPDVEKIIEFGKAKFGFSKDQVMQFLSIEKEAEQLEEIQLDHSVDQFNQINQPETKTIQSEENITSPAEKITKSSDISKSEIEKMFDEISQIKEDLLKEEENLKEETQSSSSTIDKKLPDSVEERSKTKVQLQPYPISDAISIIIKSPDLIFKTTLSSSLSIQAVRKKIMNRFPGDTSEFSLFIKGKSRSPPIVLEDDKILNDYKDILSQEDVCLTFDRLSQSTSSTGKMEKAIKTLRKSRLLRSRSSSESSQKSHKLIEENEEKKIPSVTYIDSEKRLSSNSITDFEDTDSSDFFQCAFSIQDKRISRAFSDPIFVNSSDSENEPEEEIKKIAKKTINSLYSDDPNVRECACLKIQKAYRNHLATREDKRYARWYLSRHRKRTLAVKELLTSERTYLKTLNTIIQVYLIPLRESLSSEKPLISPENMREIFSDIEMIAKYSEIFLEKLEIRIGNWAIYQKISDIITEMSPCLLNYSSYINNYKNAVHVLSQCTKKKSFELFLQQCALDSRVEGSDVTNLLIVPVQRIPRYKLLLEELLKHTWEEHPDYVNLYYATEKIKNIALTINEKIREAENIKRIAEIQTKIIGLPKPILKPGRKIRREGTLIWAGKNYHVIVFTDIILWCKQKRMEFYKVDYLQDLTAAHSNDIQNKPSFTIISLNSPAITVSVQTVKEKEEWMNLLNEPVDEGSLLLNPDREVLRRSFENSKNKSETTVGSISRQTAKEILNKDKKEVRKTSRFPRFNTLKLTRKKTSEKESEEKQNNEPSFSSPNLPRSISIDSSLSEEDGDFLNKSVFGPASIKKSPSHGYATVSGVSFFKPRQKRVSAAEIFGKTENVSSDLTDPKIEDKELQRAVENEKQALEKKPQNSFMKKNENQKTKQEQEIANKDKPDIKQPKKEEKVTSREKAGVPLQKNASLPSNLGDSLILELQTKLKQKRRLQ